MAPATIYVNIAELLLKKLIQENSDRVKVKKSGEYIRWFYDDKPTVFKSAACCNKLFKTGTLKPDANGEMINHDTGTRDIKAHFIENSKKKPLGADGKPLVAFERGPTEEVKDQVTNAVCKLFASLELTSCKASSPEMKRFVKDISSATIKNGGILNYLPSRPTVKNRVSDILAVNDLSKIVEDPQVLSYASTVGFEVLDRY